MARIVRLIEYLGTPEVLRTWIELSLAEGVSPMFGPNRQLTVQTVFSDVEGVEAGKDRPLEKWEESGKGHGGKQWREECEAVEQILMDHLRQWPNESYNDAAQRVLDRVRQVLVHLNSIPEEG